MSGRETRNASPVMPPQAQTHRTSQPHSRIWPCPLAWWDLSPVTMKEPFVPLKCCQLVKQSPSSPKLLGAQENK